MKKQKIFGYIMVVIGFLILSINAVGYIFNLDYKASVQTIIGLIFVVIGIGIVRKSKN